MSLEIERKWLLKNMPQPTTDNPVTFTDLLIKQFYIGLLRYRSRTVFIDNNKSSTFQLTAKSDGTLIRQEWEAEIPEWVFKQTDDVFTGTKIVKVIKLLRYGDLELEFHVFSDHLNGLIVLECEFPDQKTANNFILPDWIKKFVIKEITEDKKYQNKNLIINGIPK